MSAVADRRLHPSALAIRFIKKIPEFAVGLPALIGFTSDVGALYILPMIAAGASIAFGAALLGWLRFRYGVGEQDIVIESGIFQRQRRIIPFDRVQDIDIEQGLLARLFGTVTVRIETGGSGKDEGKLDAVDAAEAQWLRDVIRNRGAAQSAEVALPADEPLLFAMSGPRLLLAGFFNFSLLYLAVIGGVFQYVEPFLGWDKIDPREFVGPAGAAAGELSPLRIAAIAAVLLLLGSITGIVHTLVKNYGFRLSRSGAGLRRVRGLFTRTEIVIPLRRIQVAVLSSGIISGPLGFRTLDYQTLSADAAQSGGQTAVPFGRFEEIRPVLAESGHSNIPADEEFVRVSRRSVARRLAAGLLPFLLATLAMSFAWRGWLLLLPIFPLLIVAAILQWKRHRYALTSEALFVARGLMARRLWILPFERAHSFTVSRGPLQRRLGLATLSVDTAGASLLNRPDIVDLEPEQAEGLAAKLLELHKSARAASRIAP